MSSFALQLASDQRVLSVSCCALRDSQDQRGAFLFNSTLCDVLFFVSFFFIFFFISSGVRLYTIEHPLCIHTHRGAGCRPGDSGRGARRRGTHAPRDSVLHADALPMSGTSSAPFYSSLLCFLTLVALPCHAFWLSVRDFEPAAAPVTRAAARGGAVRRHPGTAFFMRTRYL